MINFKMLAILCIGLVGLSSCKKETVIYKGEFKGQDFVLKSIENPGIFSVNSFDYELRLGRLTPVVMDAFSTTLSVPYSLDVFKGSPYVILPVEQMPYYNEIVYDKPNSSALYFSEKFFSLEEFEQYKDLMINKWAEIDKKFFTPDPNESFTHIVGIAYGSEEKFTLTFKANYHNKPYLLEVRPDGFIKFYADDNKQQYEYNGLSPKVQMPGKIVLLEKGAEFTNKDLMTFKDEKGKLLSDYFTIKEIKN